MFDDCSLLWWKISELAVMIFGTIEIKSCRRDAGSTHDDDKVDIHLFSCLIVDRWAFSCKELVWWRKKVKFFYIKEVTLFFLEFVTNCPFLKLVCFPWHSMWDNSQKITPFITFYANCLRKLSQNSSSSLLFHWSWTVWHWLWTFNVQISCYIITMETQSRIFRINRNLRNF